MKNTSTETTSVDHSRTRPLRPKFPGKAGTEVGAPSSWSSGRFAVFVCVCVCVCVGGGGGGGIETSYIFIYTCFSSQNVFIIYSVLCIFYRV